MTTLPNSKVFKRYVNLGYIVDGSFKKRSSEVVIEHAYAKFPHSKHTFLLLLPSLQQMEHFSRFMRTVLALASSSTPRESRFKLKAGLLLVIPPDEWIDAADNFRDLAPSTKFSLPVVEQWVKTFSGGVHRQSSTPMTSITKAQHEQLARQFEHDVHQDELFRGDRLSDPPFNSAFFDKLCANVEVLNKRFDQKADAVRKAKQAAKKRRGSSVDGRAAGSGGVEVPVEWLDLQQANGAVDLTSASVDTGRRAVLQMSTPPVYAANTEGSVFSDKCRHFNLANLGTMLDHHPTVPGVNRPPYLYVGMKATMAPWHIEDGRLYSVFYLHAKSAAKFWYSVSPSKSREFEKVMGDLFPLFRQKCRRFLDHKEFFAAPGLLAQKGLPVNVLVQLESTFVITLCDVYHAVLNSGYSLGTAINFALEPWYELGQLVRRQELYCKHDLCLKRDGVNPDGSRKDSFYFIVGSRPDGTSFSARMSRRRAVVHIHMRHFSEHVHSMRILGADPSFYLGGHRPSSPALLPSGPAVSASVIHATSQTSGCATIEGSELAALASAVGRCLSEGSWRLADAPLDDALILAGHVRKAARGSMDMDALMAAVRAMSIGSGTKSVTSAHLPGAASPLGAVDSTASDDCPSLGAAMVTSSASVAARSSVDASVRGLGSSVPAVTTVRVSPMVDVPSATQDLDVPTSVVSRPGGLLGASVSSSSNASASVVMPPRRTVSSSAAAASVLQARASAAKRPHFSKRTGGAPEGYKWPKGTCHLCGQVFSRQSAANRHMQHRVCQAGARDLPKPRCVRCGTEFLYAESLRDHDRRSICGKNARARASASTSASIFNADEPMLLD